MPSPRTRKGLWLLALLALRATRTQERETLAALLWPDTDDMTAKANLRRTLTDLRQALGLDSEMILAPSLTTLCLDTAACDIDLLRFDAAPQKEWALYQGELLEGCREEWVYPERQARQESYLKAREVIAQELGNSPAAAEHLEAVLKIDPLREETARRLMELLGSSGRVPEALGVYRQLRKSLLERRLTPEPATTALFERLRKTLGTPSLAVSESPESVALPAPVTSFVGRQAERDAVLEHLNAGARLITLLGPGGAGKTRLAVEVARSLAPQHPIRGFVDCSAITEVAELPQALTRLLDLRVQEAGQHLPTLVHALRDGLLVLDNLEQLEGSPVHFLSQLLQQCPDLKLITTSRVRLQIPGEVVLRLEGLPQEHAAELFSQRAMAAGANRSLLDAAAIETLCTRLDGLPLALELAATWCSLLSPQEILNRLDARFGLLKEQNAERGLEATLCWSWERLAPLQQEQLQALALLPGSWTSGPAAAVLGQSGDELMALQAFQALADTSWLVVQPGNPSRYRLLESMRAFVQARTTEGQRRSVLNRLWDFWEHELREQPEIDDSSYRLTIIDRDLENLRVVLDDGPTDPLRALNLLQRTSLYFDFRGLAAECMTRIGDMLERLPAGTPRPGRALATYASSAIWQKEYALAQSALEEVLAMAKEAAPDMGQPYLLGTLGVCLRYQGELARAEEYHREALRLHTSPVQQGVENMRLGVVLREQGNFAEARQVFLEASTLGDTISTAGTKAEWARLEAQADNSAEARALYSQSIALHQELGNSLEVEKLEKERGALGNLSP